MFPLKSDHITARTQAQAADPAVLLDLVCSADLVCNAQISSRLN
jgi:hypothetical protein